jgi:transcriptional regulator with XRE-family HTH domain
VRSSKETIAISHDLLRELRESSGYTVESLAGKLHKSAKDIKALESGERQISVKEMEKLASLYHRPLTIFFNSEVPKIPSPTYRLNREKQLSPKFFVAERRAYYLAEREYQNSSKKKAEYQTTQTSRTQ